MSLGLLLAPARMDRVATVSRRLDAADWPSLEATYARLEADARAVIAATIGDASRSRIRRAADLRFVGHGYELVTDLPPARMTPGRRRRSGRLSSLQAKLLTDTAANWIERLNRAGVPTGPVYSMDQVFADPQVRHLGLSFPVRHPRLGEISLVRTPVQMPGVVNPRSPTLDRGEHTDAVLAEFGFTADEVATLRGEGAL